MDFGQSDLSQAVFTNCDLAGAVFEHTNLEEADQRFFQLYDRSGDKQA